MADLLGYEEWIHSLEEKADRLPKVQAALSNFQVLPRLGKLLEEKSSSCPDCKMYLGELQEATYHLDKFFDDGNNYSVDFDRLVGEIMNHLKSKHGIKPKGLVLSIKTLWGMVVGILIGSMLSFLLDSISIKNGVVIGWLFGVMCGWFWGKYKEDKLRRDNLIF